MSGTPGKCCKENIVGTFGWVNLSSPFFRRCSNARAHSPPRRGRRDSSWRTKFQTSRRERKREREKEKDKEKQKETEREGERERETERDKETQRERERERVEGDGRLSAANPTRQAKVYAMHQHHASTAHPTSSVSASQAEPGSLTTWLQWPTVR